MFVVPSPPRRLHLTLPSHPIRKISFDNPIAACASPRRASIDAVAPPNRLRAKEPDSKIYFKSFRTRHPTSQRIAGSGRQRIRMTRTMIDRNCPPSGCCSSPWLSNRANFRFQSKIEQLDLSCLRGSTYSCLQLAARWRR